MIGKDVLGMHFEILNSEQYYSDLVILNEFFLIYFGNYMLEFSTIFAKDISIINLDDKFFEPHISIHVYFSIQNIYVGYILHSSRRLCY